MVVQRIIYCSKAIEPDLTDIENILTTSTDNNLKTNVTGMLLFNAGYFLQLLEGDRTEVTRTFCRIANDPRHEQIELVSCGAVTRKLFPEWGMYYVAVTGEIGMLLRQYQAGGRFLPHRLTALAAAELCQACARLP